jgi:hypothetical protein
MSTIKLFNSSVFIRVCIFDFGMNNLLELWVKAIKH